MKSKYLILLGMIPQCFSMMQTNSNATAYEDQMIDTMKQQGLTNEQIDMAMSSIRQQQEAMSSIRQEQEAMLQKLQTENYGLVDDVEEVQINVSANLKSEAKEADKEAAKNQAKEAATDCLSCIPI